jgi:hypothetical protein
MWKENITLVLYFPLSLEYLLFSFHIGVESKICYMQSFPLCLKRLKWESITGTAVSKLKICGFDGM